MKLQAVGDFFFFDRAGFDQLPVGLGDVDRGGALAGAEAAVEDEVDAAVHHAEDFDTAAARRPARDIGAGRDQRSVQHLHQLLRNR